MRAFFRTFSLAIVISFSSIIGSTLAEENLLGLPVTRDVNKPGAVVLHGGGRITQDVFDQ